MLTILQCLVGPFAFRLLLFPTRGLAPASLPKILQEASPNFYKWSEAIVAHPSISGCTEVDTMVATTKERMERLTKTEGSAELVDALVQRAGGN